jgi:hypothetical protein
MVEAYAVYLVGVKPHADRLGALDALTAELDGFVEVVGSERGRHLGRALETTSIVARAGVDEAEARATARRLEEAGGATKIVSSEGATVYRSHAAVYLTGHRSEADARDVIARVRGFRNRGHFDARNVVALATMGPQVVAECVSDEEAHRIAGFLERVGGIARVEPGAGEARRT